MYLSLLYVAVLNVKARHLLIVAHKYSNNGFNVPKSKIYKKYIFSKRLLPQCGIGGRAVKSQCTYIKQLKFTKTPMGTISSR